MPVCPCCHVKTIFMDGTFKVIYRRPFVQLFSLDTFVKCDNNVKQVLLVFALMSRRQAKDYRGVFKELRGLVNIKWDVIVSDFSGSGACYEGNISQGSTPRDQKRSKSLSAKRLVGETSAHRRKSQESLYTLHNVTDLQNASSSSSLSSSSKYLQWPK